MINTRAPDGANKTEIPRKKLPLKMGEKNLNKDFSNTRRGGGFTILRKFFSKFYIFLNDGFPNSRQNIIGTRLTDIVSPPGGQKNY